MTKDEYGEVSNDSPLFAMDCEMCLTTTNESELTRITVVNEKSEVCVSKTKLLRSKHQCSCIVLSFS